MFPEERSPDIEDEQIVRIRLNELQLRRPRQWGACWLSSVLYQKLELDAFWLERLTPSRKGTRWDQVLRTLVSYRLIDPGASSYRRHFTRDGDGGFVSGSLPRINGFRRKAAETQMERENPEFGRQFTRCEIGQASCASAEERLVYSLNPPRSLPEKTRVGMYPIIFSRLPN